MSISYPVVDVHKNRAAVPIGNGVTVYDLTGRCAQGFLVVLTVLEHDLWSIGMQYRGITQVDVHFAFVSKASEISVFDRSSVTVLVVWWTF